VVDRHRLQPRIIEDLLDVSHHLRKMTLRLEDVARPPRWGSRR
jgi:hypothetical protein